MKSIRHKPLWARLCAYSLSLLVFLQNLVYPWISILPAPPPIYAQEASPPEASLSANTPAPSPLDLPLDLGTIFPTTQSADLQPPEATPEADLIQVPEATPEASLSPSATPSANPTLTPLPSPTFTTSSTSPSPSITGTLDNGNTGTQNTIPTVPSTPIPSLDPFFITLSYPFAGNYPLSYGFGEASDSSYVQLMQNLFDVEAHDGLDFAMPEGTEILSASAGRVIRASIGVYGTTVIIQHSWGRSYYGHLSQTSVTVDQEVSAGQIIGLSGNSGISTGPHLHFGIRPNHYDPFNGYHGMIDPLPYLQGKVLGSSITQKRDLIHLPFTTLSPDDLSAPITLLNSDSTELTFELINPKGQSNIVYPSFYNYGTGESAILSRPTPFIPGNYALRTTNSAGEYDEQTFAWGVIALNPDQSLYSLGDRANLAMAVLDGYGEMVCDANIQLIIKTPSGQTQTLSTATGEIGVNYDTCTSKSLTLTPDYQTSFETLEVGEYNLTLTASTTSSTNTIVDHLSVEENPEFDLRRLTATRIYPAHQYPVIFALTPAHDYQGNFTEIIPQNFEISNLSEAQLKDWSQAQDQSQLINTSYVQKDKELTWQLDLKAEQTYYFGYLYDAPDISPQLFALGPAALGDWQESRTWSIAVDAIEKSVGFFSPPRSWTTAADTDLVLAQPDPRDGDLMIATISVRPSSSSFATPSGWTLLESRTASDGGAEGVDAGSVGTFIFYKEADGTEGSSTVTFTESGTTNVSLGMIHQVRSATGTYNIDSAGYSITTDATNWNGTLDSDPGMTAGDIYILVAGQVGDASNTSAWGLESTGATSLSSVNEHGEFTTGNGNDIEVGMAVTQVWEGTGTTTPTVTLTQSVAVAGTVSAIRIRQGSGTNRSDNWVRSAGAQIAGTTSVIVPYPEHEMGDLIILFVGSRISTDATPTTPTGWTSLGTFNGGTGTFGVDAGNARTTAYYRQANLRMTGTQTVSLGSGNTMVGQMISVHHDGDVTWVLDSDGGTDSTADTAWSVAGSGIDLDSANGGDIVLTGSAINADAYTYTSPTFSATGGIGVGEVTLTGQYNSLSGNDMALTIANARITSGSGSGLTPTYGMTSSGAAGSAPAGSSLFVKINSTAITTDDNHLGYFSPPTTWTAAGNATLNLAQPDPRDGDLMIATIGIRPSSSTVGTPAGWTFLDSQTGTDSGAEGADTGTVGLYTFYKVADGTEGFATVGFTETGTTSAFIGNISKLRSSTGAYDLSSGGYSINGDATNWNGTLDTDIGLTQGDVVILLAAQNGDLSATSAWDINATSITSKSSVNEHGEYATTTGNDLEVGLATAQIWEGTNTATPTLTLTQSVAASGTVMAVRIRQGSGTNRTDAWVRSAGPQIGGTSSVVVAFPEHEIGDLLLLFVGSRATADNTPTTPVGWTSLGTYNGGTGTFGADAGNARTTVFSLHTKVRMTGTQTVSITSGNTAIGQILAIHQDGTGLTWGVDTDGGADSTAGTAWSVVGSGIDLDSANGGDLVLIGSSINTDAYTYNTPTLTSSGGVGVGEVTLTGQFITTGGNDMGLTVATARITSGSGTGVTPTYGMTASGTAGSAPTGSSMFIKINGIPESITVAGTANGNDTATVKIAINNTIQAQTTTISSGTWSITNVAEPATNDIITVWVDGVGDSNETTAVTKWSVGDITGMVLNTNVLTLGSNQDTSLSLTNLNLYDCTEDEDIMHQTASSHFKVEGDSCAGSTTNSYSSEQLSVLASDTLAVATSESVTTYDLTNAGTITSTGNSNYNISHDWANTGTFTPDTSTVNLTGADSTTQTISGTTTFNNLSATTSSNSAGRTIRFTAGTTNTVTGTWTITGTASKIITLESSAASAWTINPTAASVSYVSVSYSTNNGVSFCANTSTDGGNNLGWNFLCSPTPYSFQRKTFYDDQNARYWRFSYDGAAILSEYSSDGSSWNTSNTLPYQTNDFDIGWASVSGTEYAYLAVSHNHDILLRRGTLNTTSVTWDGTVSTALNGTSLTDHYSYPVVTLDSSNLIWVGARYYNGTNYSFKTTSTRQANTITHQETVTGTAITSPTSVVSASITGTTNHLYLATISTKGNDAVSSVSGIGLTWTLVRAQCGARAQTRTEIWYALGTPSGNGTITANFGSAPEEAVIAVSRYSNVDTANPIGNSVGKNTVGVNDTTCTGGTDDTNYTVDITSSQDGALIFGGVGIRQYSHTPGSAYTELADFTSSGGGTGAGLAIQEDIVTSPSTVAFDGSVSAVVDYSVVTLEIAPSTTSTTLADTLSSWGWLSSKEISAAQSNANVYGNLTSLGSSNVYAALVSNTSIQGCLWNNSTLRWENTAGSSCASGANIDSIATATSSISTSLSLTADASFNLHLIYINSSGHSIYQERTTSWQSAVTLDSNAGNAYPTISLDTSSSDLYAFWIRGDDIYYKKGVSNYTSGNWDASATAWQTAGTNTYLTSNFASSNKIFAEWYDGTNLVWDELALGGSNTAPNAPTSLAQKTTGDVTITTGSWHNNTSVKFSATATDTDNPDTLYLCVEADTIATSFSNAEDSCGSGVSYTGSGVTLTHTLTLTDAQEYHWQVRVKDTAGAYSSWVSYDVNAESARDVGIDSTAPTGGTVYDGTGVGVDITFATSSLSSISANWGSINTDVSGLLRYDYSIGTSPGATNIKAWTDNTTSTSVTATGLTLQTSQLYYVNVRAVDNATNVQTAISSNGQLVSPSISFATTPATATFANLGAGNSYSDTDITTLTTSTNAYNGYVIRAFVTDYLRSTDSLSTISDFSGGTYASPATWSGSETGFGYTSSDTTIQGSNKFGTGSLYAPFTQTGPGDIVADHTTNVTGTSISNESFDITYKVKVDSGQAAKTYNTAVVYTATAQY